ncbi:MAG: hypothetical protein ACAI44_06835 [Candidatus Sericytochromatia bacterium]
MKYPIHLPPLIGLILLLLVSGLLGGLARLGWPIPLAALASLHGPVMICGFLGTLIGLERAAAAAGRKWAYAAPALSAGASLGLLAGLPLLAGAGLIIAAATVQLALLSLKLRQAASLPLLLQILGLGCWLMGTLVWMLGWPFPLVALWWGGLLLLTIAGGRMDQFLPAGTLFQGPGRGFALAAATYVVGLALAMGWPDAGLRLSALGLGGCALWLLARDPACRLAGRGRSDGFFGLCLLLGYGWIGVAAVLLAVGAGALTGFWYDMTLHSLFVGFVFALILGHLPRILPMLLGRRELFHPLFYFWLALLQLSLLLRLAGDTLAAPAPRAWGGLLNVAALLGFLLVVLWQLGISAKGSDSKRSP